MTPKEAWNRIVREDAPTDDSPLDYTDDEQTSKSVLLDGERWAIVIRRCAAL